MIISLHIYKNYEWILFITSINAIGTFRMLDYFQSLYHEENNFRVAAGTTKC